MTLLSSPLVVIQQEFVKQKYFHCWCKPGVKDQNYENKHFKSSHNGLLKHCENVNMKLLNCYLNLITLL